MSRLSVKLGQKTHRHRTTSPRLSGDFFASKCDLTIKDGFIGRRAFRKDLERSSVIFCNGSLVLDFIKHFGDSLGGKVLLVGNSDRDWHDFPISDCPKIKGVFLQNSFLANELIHTLPIGIENISYFRNGRSRNFEDRLVKQIKADQVMVGPFSPTHPIRLSISESIVNSPRVKINSYNQVDPFTYASISSRFGYIASPRGNGEDTHRLWESLYRGSSPVVLRNIWSERLVDLNLPIHLVDLWSQSSLEALPVFEPFSPKLVEALWWPYWRSKIDNLL